MKKTGLIIIIAIGIILNGCTERIEIELDSTYTRLVVEGHITNETKAHWVRLTKSVDYYSTTPAPTISNALVTINDGFKTDTLVESNNSDSAGYYLTPTNYFGKIDSTYLLKIDIPEEINGEKQYTASSKLNPVAPIDSIRIEYFEDWYGYWEVQLFAWDPAETENYYTFNVYRNDTLLTYPVNEVSITDDSYFNGNYINGAAIYYFVNDEEYGEYLYPGDTITVHMGGITEEYYNFLYEFQEETSEFRNPLFSGPPANISTNISNGAIGFFAAYSVSYASTVYQE